MLDKRHSKRVASPNAAISLRSLDPQVWFRFPSGAEYAVRDLSLVGVGVYSAERLPDNMPVSIDLRIGRASSTIRVFGRIVWTAMADNQYCSGISFSWWKDDADKKAVNSFVEQLASKN